MSKALELISTLIDGANEYEKKTGNTNPTVYLSKNNLLIIQRALNRLESIDNSNPSEALEELIDMIEYFTRLDYVEPIVRNEIHDKFKDIYWHKLPHLDSIKEALIKAEKEHNSINLLMQELDCKDFAELRKYARCGYQTFRNAKGANYDNIIIDEAVIPSEAIVEKSLKALEIIKEKRVNIYFISTINTYDEYLNADAHFQPNVVDYMGNYHKEQVLTEEEFELLRSLLE